jgi:hypothetical protein
MNIINIIIRRGAHVPPSPPEVAELKGSNGSSITATCSKNNTRYKRLKNRKDRQRLICANLSVFFKRNTVHPSQWVVRTKLPLWLDHCNRNGYGRVAKRTNRQQEALTITMPKGIIVDVVVMGSQYFVSHFLFSGFRLNGRAPVLMKRQVSATVKASQARRVRCFFACTQRLYEYILSDIFSDVV